MCSDNEQISAPLDSTNIERLFVTRQLYLEGDFNEQSIAALIRQLHVLQADAEDAMKDPLARNLTIQPSWSDFRVTLHLSSYGGSVHEFLRLYSVIHSLDYPVDILAGGKAMSAGAMLLLSGTGVRAAHEHTSIMIHTIQTIEFGDLNEIGNSFEESKRLEKALKNIIKKHTKYTKAEIDELFHKDSYMTPQQALKHGVIDRIVRSTPSSQQKNWRLA